ncbi:hypothetical protein ACNKHP_05770 [Shigella boydii]
MNIPNRRKRRELAIDLAAESTELVIGENFEPILVESRRMGCVSFALLSSLAGSWMGEFSARWYRSSAKTGKLNLAIPYQGSTWQWALPVP